jgi:hypothetical protein
MLLCLCDSCVFYFKLRSLGNRLKLKKQTGGRRPLWWDYELLDWIAYDGKFEQKWKSKPLSVLLTSFFLKEQKWMLLNLYIREQGLDPAR